MIPYAIFILPFSIHDCVSQSARRSRIVTLTCATDNSAALTLSGNELPRCAEPNSRQCPRAARQDANGRVYAEIQHAD